MSKLFYDHLIFIDDLWQEIDLLELTVSEKTKLKNTVDEIMHTRVFTLLFDLLPQEFHEDFLKRFHARPYDVVHLGFITEKSGKDMHAEIVVLAKKVKIELLQDIRQHRRQKQK